LLERFVLFSSLFISLIFFSKILKFTLNQFSSELFILGTLCIGGIIYIVFCIAFALKKKYSNRSGTSEERERLLQSFFLFFFLYFFPFFQSNLISFQPKKKKDPTVNYSRGYFLFNFFLQKVLIIFFFFIHILESRRSSQIVL